MRRALSHDEALDCIIGAAGVTTLSYQEAVESYLMLRRLEHLFTASATEGESAPEGDAQGDPS